MFQISILSSLNVLCKVSVKLHSSQRKGNLMKASLLTKVKMIKWTSNAKVKKENLKLKSTKLMMQWMNKIDSDLLQ